MDLLNPITIRKYITAHAKCKHHHGSTEDYIGAGIIYYSLVYLLKAKLCVCLGSGGGFVPRIMRQAQRDLGISDISKTVIVDGNMPLEGWGSPDYFVGPTFFTDNFDVELIEKKTVDAVVDLGKIDYLHIDANHEYEHVKEDFWNYRKLMSVYSFVTFHDTDSSVPSVGVSRFLRELRMNKRFEIFNFPFIGEGSAIVQEKHINLL